MSKTIPKYSKAPVILVLFCGFVCESAFFLLEGKKMIQPYMNNNMYPQTNPYMTKTIDTNNNILWVDGEVGAKAYPLYGMNNGVILMDREEEDVIYIKTTDSQGRPNTQRYKIVPEQKKEIQTTILNEYVRKDELQDLLKSILQPAQEGEKDEQTISTTQPAVVKRTVL